MPCSQDPTTGPCPEPDERRITLPPIHRYPTRSLPFRISNWIFATHLVGLGTDNLMQSCTVYDDDETLSE
jgi:hypothetical protein